MLRFILNLLFPKRCVGCRTVGTYICLRCLKTLPPSEPISLPNTLACFSYHDPRIKELIWKLKYQKLSSIAESIGPALYDRIFEEISDRHQFSYTSRKILLIPIPLSSKRHRERGFNQAEVIARALARQNEEIFEVDTSVIKKVRETTTQVSRHNRKARIQNLTGAFALVKPGAVHNRFVVVIDDVITTGTTINEVRKLLLEAREVFSLALAHG